MTDNELMQYAAQAIGKYLVKIRQDEIDSLKHDLAKSKGVKKSLEERLEANGIGNRRQRQEIVRNLGLANQDINWLEQKLQNPDVKYPSYILIAVTKDVSVKPGGTILRLKYKDAIMNMLPAKRKGHMSGQGADVVINKLREQGYTVLPFGFVSQEGKPGTYVFHNI